MSTDVLVDVLREAVLVAFKIGLPVLLVSLIVGLIVAIFQAATQISEQSIGFTLKLLVTGVVLVILGPWMLETLADFVMYITDLIITLS